MGQFQIYCWTILVLRLCSKKAVPKIIIQKSYKMFSFIISVKDVPFKYFKECVDSIKHSAKNISYEIVICNDGSNSLISNQYESFLSKEQNINYIKFEKSVGIALARNACIKNSKGEWLAIVDADDAVTIDYIQKIAPYLNHNTAMIYSDHYQYDENLTEIIQFRNKKIYHELYQEFANTELDPMLWSTYIFHPQIFNREAFFDIGLFNETYGSGDEAEVHIKLSEKFGMSSISYVPNSLYKYRKNKFSVVHDENYYKYLILNIESILSLYYSKRSGKKSYAKKVGRCENTNAAHYQHFTIDNTPILLPYFDFETLKIRSLNEIKNCT
jgi:glycosyltransferase involved in cell wall biosynthesis